MNMLTFYSTDPADRVDQKYLMSLMPIGDPVK
jgi:hypothetical protein